MLALLRMELLKLLKRPMTWVLFILLHGGIGFVTVVGAINLTSANPETREQILNTLTLPRTIPYTAEFIVVFGMIMLAILAASSIGSEYSWGTLRTQLITGMGRSRFLTAKLLALALIGALFVLLPLAMNSVLGMLIAALNHRPLIATTIDLAWLGKLAAISGRTYLIIMVPMLIAFFVGLAARSQAAGIGAALGLLIGEQIVAVLLVSLKQGWATTLVNILPGRNTQILANFYNGFTPPPPPPGTPTEARTILTLLVYSFICLLVSFLIFRKRDIRGAA